MRLQRIKSKCQPFQNSCSKNPHVLDPASRREITTNKPGSRNPQKIRILPDIQQPGEPSQQPIATGSRTIMRGSPRLG